MGFLKDMWKKGAPAALAGNPLGAMTQALRSSDRNKERGGNLLDQYAGSDINKVLDPLDIFGGQKHGAMWDNHMALQKKNADYQNPGATLQAPPGPPPGPGLGTPSAPREYVPNRFSSAQPSAAPAQATQPLNAASEGFNLKAILAALRARRRG